MKKTIKFLSLCFSAFVVFIFLLNLSNLISPPKQISKNYQIDTLNNQINLNGISISRVFQLTRNLKIYSPQWCTENNQVCKDLFAYSLGRRAWKNSQMIAQAFCHQKSTCPLSDLIQRLQIDSAQPRRQINNFHPTQEWTHFVEVILGSSNLEIDGILCAYQELTYRQSCHYENQKLSFNLSEANYKKSNEQCLTQNSTIDCWISAKQKKHEYHDKTLTKACTLDSAPACYQVGLAYKRKGHQFLAQKYLEKSCLLHFQSACFLISHENKNIGNQKSQKYFLDKACLLAQNCAVNDRLPASL